MCILSIQSTVAWGHVGNAAAALPLRRLGFEVAEVDTVQFSNHPGHGAWRGRICPAAEIGAIIDGIAARGVFPRCEAVLSGYLGEAATGETVLSAVARVKAANPGAIYCCDPVFGDNGALYTGPDIPAFFRDRAIPHADILIPNLYELETLTGIPVRSLGDAMRGAAAIRTRGPGTVVVTSLRHEGTGTDDVETLAVSAEGAFRVVTPMLPVRTSGAGDAFAALFLGHRLKGADTGEALAAAVSAVFAVIAATRDAGSGELALVAAQDSILNPPRRFRALRL